MQRSYCPSRYRCDSRNALDRSLHTLSTFLFRTKSNLADREAAIATFKEKFWKMHHSEGSHWIMIIESKTGKVVAGSQWTIHTKNPYPDGYVPEKIVAVMWPEGTVGRDFVSEMLRQLYKPRQSYMQRPIAFLNAMGTHPNFRRRGAASLLLEWGETRAAKLHLDIFIEASGEGRMLYEKCGYRILKELSLDAEREDASDEWKKLAHELLPQPVCFMWKSAGGEVNEKSAMPWSLETKSK